MATGTALTAVALAAEAVAPSLWMFACGMVVLGLGFGAVDAAVNIHAACHFSARKINWMHASYGATVGPLLGTLTSNALTWLWVYGILGGAQAVLALALSEGFRAEGSVRLSRSRIGGAISLHHARLETPGGDAIRRRQVTVSSLRGTRVGPRLTGGTPRSSR